MNNNDTYLAHHGIKGQKWGIRRYQNADGSLTAEGRKRKGLGAPRRSLKERLADRKAAQEKTPEQAKEELKEYLRKHPKKLPKYGSMLTRAEAQEVINNIQFDRQLKDIRKQEIDRGFETIRTVTNTMQTVGNAINAGKNVYNAYVDVHNSLGSGKKLSKIGETKKEDRGSWEKLVKTGSAQDILNNIANLTSGELETAVKRLNYEDQLRKKIAP